MSEDERRRARRAFVRDDHPDRGGDPWAFVKGLARFDVTNQSGESEIVVYRRRRFRMAGTLSWRPSRWRRHTTRVR
jgi:hypothetical protein